MGYRHQVISDTLVPKKEFLPIWFLEKYHEYINFDNDFWCSFSELKRYNCPFANLERDVQILVTSLNLDNIRLVYFADESDCDSPDIRHINITKSEITELVSDGWSEI